MARTTKPEAWRRLTPAARRDLLALARGERPCICYGPGQQLVKAGLAWEGTPGPESSWAYRITDEGRALAAEVAD